MDLFVPALSSPSSAVVITGGASGIGLATAEALAAVGRPMALWDINEAAAAAAAERIATSRGIAAIGIGIDLRDLGAIEPALTRTSAAVGRPGGLVH